VVSEQTRPHGGANGRQRARKTKNSVAPREPQKKGAAEEERLPDTAKSVRARNWADDSTLVDVVEPP